MTKQQILYKYFGYETFRHGQEEIIDHILQGENVVAILPTGGGKSLCYQIPALMDENFSIVISPLIALMKDQVDSLNHNEKIAAFINSTLDYPEIEKVLNDIAIKKIKILYLAPEKLENNNFVDRIKALSPAYIFVDEAHCISEWGHNFRPSYRRINEFCENIGVKKISAFTATATPRVKEDIIKQLGLSKPKTVVHGFERENLSLNILKTKKKKEKTLELINKHQKPVIIYTATRKESEDLAQYLNFNGIQTVYYHAGLQPELRRMIQDDFLNDRVKVITATNAFGMGIDKTDIRLIIHYNMPGTIESYYQEIGRAGRDGKNSSAFLLYAERDRQIQDYFIRSSNPTIDNIEKVYNTICDYGSVAIGSKPETAIPLDKNFNLLISANDIPNSIINASLKTLEDAEYIKFNSGFASNHFIIMNLKQGEIKSYIESIANNFFKDLLYTLLREYSGSLFRQKVKVDIDKISSQLICNKDEIIDALIKLNEIGIIKYDKPILSPAVYLTKERVAAEHLEIDTEKLEKRLRYANSKLEKMLEYIETHKCRTNFILKYFGEENLDYKCGKCDICTGGVETPEFSIEYLEEIILTSLHELKRKILIPHLIQLLQGKSKRFNPSSCSTFGTCAHFSKAELEDAISSLITKGLIKEFEKNLFLTDTGQNYFIDEKVEHSAAPIEIKDYETDLELFNLLRQARKESASRFNQNALMICPDETLREIAKSKPDSPTGILSVNGFNQRAFNKVGEEFLSIIKEFNKKLNRKEIINKNKIPNSSADLLELINKKYSLESISSLMKTPESLIAVQVESLMAYFPDLEIQSLFDKNEFEQIKEKFKSGITDIKELKKSLPAGIGYNKIKIAVAKLKSI